MVNFFVISDYKLQDSAFTCVWGMWDKNSYSDLAGAVNKKETDVKFGFGNFELRYLKLLGWKMHTRSIKHSLCEKL